MADIDQKAEPMERKASAAAFNLEYLLEQIQAIQRQTEHLNLALEKLGEMKSDGVGTPGSPEDLLGQAKAQAIAEVVAVREKTNQGLLEMYQKMYDDLCPCSERMKEISERILKTIEKMVENLESDYLEVALNSVANILDKLQKIR